MNNKEIKSFISYISIKNELNEASLRGMKLALEGTLCEPERLARICAFREETAYMRDYITDEKNNVSTMNFNSVDNR